MTATDDAKDRRKAARRLPRLLAGGAAALLGLAGGIAWLTATDGGLRWLASLAGDAVAVEGLSGSLWREVRADRIVYRDADGLDVEVQDASVSWSPWQLVHGVLQLGTVRAARLSVVLPSVQTDTGSDGGLFPRPPVAIRIEQFDLPEIVLATSPGAVPHRLRASGHARVAAAEGSVVLDVQGVAPEGDRLTLDAAHSFSAPGRLRIDAEASLTGDSPLWPLLGVGPEQARPLRLSVRGDGPLDAWNGRLEADMADGGAVEARLTTAGPGRFSVAGEVTVAAGGLLDVSPALAGTTTFRADGEAKGESRIALSRLTFQKQGLVELNGTGWFDLAAEVASLDLSLALDPAAARLVGADSIAWREASVSGRIEGPVAAPVLHGTAQIVGAAAPSLETADIGIDWRLEPHAGKASATLRMTGARWSEPVLDALLGAAPELDLAAAGDADGAARLERLALHGAALQGAISGRLNSDGGISGDGELRIPDLAPLSIAAGIDMTGAARLRLDAMTRTPDGTILGNLALTASEARIGPPELSEILGTAPALRAALRLAPDGGLTLENVVLASAAADLEGRMTLSPDGTRMDAAVQGRLQPAAAAVFEGVSFEQPLELALDIAGDPSAPTGRLRASGTAVTLSGTSLAQPRATVQFGWRSGDPLLSAALEAAVEGTAATAAFDALIQSERIALSAIRIQAAGLKVEGAATLPKAGLPAAGRLTVSAGDLGTVEALAGLEDIKGTLRGTLILSAAADRQVLEVDLRAEKLSLVPMKGDEPLSVRQVAVTGAIRDLMAGKGLDLDIRLSGLRRGEVLAADGRASLRGNLAAVQTSLSLSGRAVAPFELAAALAMTESGTQRRVDIQRLDGRYDGRLLALDGPSYVVLGPAGPTEAAVALRAGDGRAAARLGRAGGRPTLTATLDRLPLGLLAAAAGRNIGGQLSGSLDLSESARGVNGRADFSLRGVGAADLKDVPPVDAKLAVAVEPAALDLSLTVTGADLRQADLRGRVPVRLSLSPPGGRAVGNGRMDLRLSLAGDAGTLWPYIGPPDQRLSGEVAVAAHLTGTPDAPRIDGTAGVDAGRYEHLIYGTLLTGLTMRAELADRHLILREFRAADGGSGSLSASGDATLETGGAMRFAMQAEGRGVHLLRRDELRAMGDLDIRVEGNAEGAKVGGTVTVSAAEIDLAAALPPAIPTLDVHRAGDRELDRAAAQAAAYPVALDVAVAIPGQTFVRGRGLDSEWRGRLNLKGMAAAPRLTGELEAVRGQFDAIGRSFALRSSTIQFDGGAQIDPVLGIRGEYKTRDLTVVARLVGRASNPSLELDSTPALPRDEILSRVLFGKSRGRLTPVEGAQLAAALSELSGGGPSLDVLGTLRRMAGIDVLQVDTEEGATSVRAGKYVTDRVYVGARQGAASGSGGVEVEVELTPNISVNSSGQGGRSDVELLFKWDY